mmetsp:Transcript_40489/g.114589  ORF Transcript_40489/g.114589 Transcript_40489/m.114589 type:complete len:241 (-) Transcript_40489:8-730(-)
MHPLHTRRRPGAPGGPERLPDAGVRCVVRGRREVRGGARAERGPHLRRPREPALGLALPRPPLLPAPRRPAAGVHRELRHGRRLDGAALRVHDRELRGGHAQGSEPSRRQRQCVRSRRPVGRRALWGVGDPGGLAGEAGAVGRRQHRRARADAARPRGAAAGACALRRGLRHGGAPGDRLGARSRALRGHGGGPAAAAADRCRACIRSPGRAGRAPTSHTPKLGRRAGRNIAPSRVILCP